jgi:tocopherol cyclase
MLMAKIQKLMTLVAISLSFSLQANVDVFNTYRWNRSNALNNTGKIDTTPWYEWWYYKVVLPEQNESFFFVYGVVNPWDHQGTLKGTRSYVGMGDFTQKKQVENKYDVSSFKAKYNQTYISVGSNTASDKSLTGHLKGEDGLEHSWNINIQGDWAFNATSWATGRMITNIEWYPAQASAKCSGSIYTSGREITFQDAPCYQDRNWGKSFPQWWTWIVSNHFENDPTTALAIGGGKPKFFDHYNLMEGVAIGLRHEGKEYSWRPNEFDKVKMDISFGRWEVVGIGKKYKIEVSAYAPKNTFMDLEFMTPMGETFHDYETLTGDITVKLYKRKLPFFMSWELINTFESHFGGIEFGSKDEYEFTKAFSGHKELYNSTKRLF